MPHEIAAQARRRRTFAIISHPDAGKTTLTEKLLLYSGSIHLAGSIRARKAVRHAVSDWMKMEQERGISVTSSVLQFEYQGSALNLLDTPGHADFSEDTYRTLAAVDSAVMLIDHTKGVEARTLKLFEVCRLRQLPVISFMNKMDREGRDPIELIDEIAETLHLKVAAINWPLGMGRNFRGVIDIQTRRVLLFSGGGHGSAQATIRSVDVEEARKSVGSALIDEGLEQLELLEGAGDPWDAEAFRRGELSPVFWGSAMTNFGIEPFLNFLSEHAAPPGPRKARTHDGEDLEISPESPDFAGFIFKIQANMNPRHRDRIAFMRVVSGRFERGMDARLARTGGPLRMANPHTFMANERSIVEEAWPGDIVGLHDPGKLRIGDTISTQARMSFAGIPRFAPEHFSRMVLKNPLKRKQLDLGLNQLAHEGVVQVFHRPEIGLQDPWLGAVGLLQFEVLKERLANEYGAQCVLESLPVRFARWIGGEPEGMRWLERARDCTVVLDSREQPVLLTESLWAINYALKNAPGLILHEVEPLY